jgi:hypothetical protein
MPGEEFYPNGPRVGTMRLNFSHADAVDANRGLRVLAGLIRERSAAWLLPVVGPGDGMIVTRNRLRKLRLPDLRGPDVDEAVTGPL